MEKEILIVTNHFYPETFRVNDVAFFLAANGYSVSVITGIPNYPGGKFFQGFHLFKKNVEKHNGVKIIRLPIIPRGNGKGVRLLLNYLSYFTSLSIFSIFLVISKKYSLILVHHTSPIFLALPAIFIKKVQGIKLILWNLDLWPESVTAASKVSNALLFRLLGKIVSSIYKQCDIFLIPSKAFETNMIMYGANGKLFSYFPNWAEDVFVEGIREKERINRRSNTRFRIMYAGNIGVAQDLDSVLVSIALLRAMNEDVEWIFVGDGRYLGEFKKKVSEKNVSDVVSFLGRQNLEKMPQLFNEADVMFLSLSNSEIFALTVPARLQAFMCSGKPVLAMINGECGRIIREADCGIAVASGDSNGLVDAVLKLKNLSSEERKQLGQNALEYYKKNFDKTITFARLTTIVEEYRQK